MSACGYNIDVIKKITEHRIERFRYSTGSNKKECLQMLILN